MRFELGTRRLPCRVNDHEVDRHPVLRIDGISGEHLEAAPAGSPAGSFRGEGRRVGPADRPHSSRWWHKIDSSVSPDAAAWSAIAARCAWVAGLFVTRFGSDPFRVKSL
jgi:hypothetical protein